MTIIKNSKKCIRKFKNDFKNVLFSEDDGKVLKAWATEMEEHGPKYIADSSEWRDHLLEREWAGYRASCFSIDGRIIYRIIDLKTVEVCEVERITPDHNYKK
jgi:mRNA-degrading endonuclease YafQ of YafQ-DinJ toxin-antitoxin module